MLDPPDFSHWMAPIVRSGIAITSTVAAKPNMIYVSCDALGIVSLLSEVLNAGTD
eukprot:m.23042 g.23042  ORF g.23042 m.23042 type:complete len:55 (-) comp12887_c1_seq1:11-175(-)